MANNEAINKLVYFGSTLFDLTGDDVTAANVHSGIKFHGRDGKQYTGTDTRDSNTQDADAVAANILKNKTAYVKGSKVTGTMENRGAVTGSISTKAGQYTVPVGYHDGSGKVSIASSEQAKIIATNIREGVTILGVEGTMSGSESERPYAHTVTPEPFTCTYLPSEYGDYTCFSQVVVNAVEYEESDNAQGGVTVVIGHSIGVN